MSAPNRREPAHLNLALFGPAGAGKGTQAEMMRRELGLEHIATGDMLREARARGGQLGETIAAYLDSGRLVPDEVIVAMIRHRLRELPPDTGFVLDGFPRTVVQARELQEMLSGLGRPLDLLLVLEVPEEQLLARLRLRATEEGRGDDNPGAIGERLRIYRQDTEPVLDYLAGSVPLVHVDGTRTVAEVSEALRRAIG